MRGHAAFESLAGAIALGEATQLERERFESHAIGCDRCRADLESDPLFVPSVLRAVAERESWRPDARDRVDAAIAERRRGRVRTIGTWIGVAAAFSVALDVGFTNGTIGRALARLSVGEASGAPVAFVSKSLPGATTAAIVAAPVAPVLATHLRPHHVAVTVVRPPLATVAAPPPVKPASADVTLPGVDDVFEGLADVPSEKASHLAKADPAASSSPAADDPESTLPTP